MPQCAHDFQANCTPKTTIANFGIWFTWSQHRFRFRFRFLITVNYSLQAEEQSIPLTGEFRVKHNQVFLTTNYSTVQSINKLPNKPRLRTNINQPEFVDDKFDFELNILFRCTAAFSFEFFSFKFHLSNWANLA